MKRTFYSLFMAFLLGMAGTQAWADDLTTTEIDGVTYYVINNGEEFKMFADLVSNGELGANAVLKADISLLVSLQKNALGLPSAPAEAFTPVSSMDKDTAFQVSTQPAKLTAAAYSAMQLERPSRTSALPEHSRQQQEPVLVS